MEDLGGPTSSSGVGAADNGFEKMLNSSYTELAELAKTAKTENQIINEHITKTGTTNPKLVKDMADLKTALDKKMSNRCRWGQRFDRAEDGCSPSYRVLATNEERHAFKQSWGLAKLSEIEKSQINTESFTHGDRTRGTYRSLRWLLREEGPDGLLYAKKLTQMGGN